MLTIIKRLNAYEPPGRLTVLIPRVCNVELHSEWKSRSVFRKYDATRISLKLIRSFQMFDDVKANVVVRGRTPGGKCFL